MFLLMSVFVLFLCLMCMLVNNVMMWWSIFLLMTLMFVTINKKMESYSTMMNYFIMQESLGLMFLLLTSYYMQLMILMMKIGVAPLHFWIFSVTNNVNGMNLMWFLTFQKLPFFFVLLQMLINYMLMFLLMGVLLCMIQMLVTKSFKNLMILSSTESFNWILMSWIFMFVNSIYVFLYYLIFMLYLINNYSKNEKSKYFSWETVLVFMNLPLTVNFFVKIYALMNVVLNINIYIMILLFFMFMTILSMSFWMINLSVKNINNNEYNKFIYLVIMPLMTIMMI
uniref:NADH dehydrogenase subunit 2 n=1 Tax=Haemonchus contortus TaxID=6289 RepID=B1P8S3_HAECO|nr:NADH dehydrogenase subunit 2 [Haemonchus contortus]ABY64776.1 NADH dehydrogenase subunit 2 [Haemonchus contortus]